MTFLRNLLPPMLLLAWCAAPAEMAGQGYDPGGARPGSPVYDPYVQPATAPMPPPATTEPVPLRSSAKETTPNLSRSTPSALPSIVTMLASLAIVLGLFVLAAWFLRRTLPAGARVLPSEVVEVLGRAPLAARQQAHLVRIGNKLILLSISPTATETLTEITDPDEVDRLASLCQAAPRRGGAPSFRQMFSQLRQAEPENLPPADAPEDGHG